MDFQILDRVEDVRPVLDDLAEQPAQGLAALVQDAGRVEDGPVDPAALEDADVFEAHAVGGEELVGVHLHSVHATQLLNGRPAGHHSTGGGSGLLEPQGGKARHQGGREGGAHAEHAAMAAAMPLSPPPNSRNTKPLSTDAPSRMYAVLRARRSLARSPKLCSTSASSHWTGRLSRTHGPSGRGCGPAPGSGLYP